MSAGKQKITDLRRSRICRVRLTTHGYRWEAGSHTNFTGGRMPRAKTICAKPGCPAITAERMCLEHRREADKARGTREQRGYDHAHRSLRKAFSPEHKAGTLICWRCRELIPPTEPFDLGHDDNDRTLYRGAEHANRCNRAAGGRKSHQ